MTGSKILRLTIAAAALLFFVWLAAEVVHGRTQRFDDGIRMLVHAHASPPLTAIMRGISLIGAPAVLIVVGALAIVFFVRTQRSRTAMLYLLAVPGAQVLGESLKAVLHRPRPATFFGLAEPTSYSFPSGHAVGSCAFFCALAVFAAAHTGSRVRRWLYYMGGATAIAAIGFSRIYLGMHYPSDVLGGYAVAVFWLSIVPVL